MILTNSGVLKLMQRIKSYIASQLNTKASSVHTHSISEIDDLSSLQMGGGYTKSEVDTLLNGKSDTGHTHTVSDVTDFPSLATVATSGSYNDLSNKPATMTPTSHTHGNITNDGKIGSNANKPLITTTGGTVTTGSFGTSANTFCEGNDSRLSDARTPTAHTHTVSDVTDLPSLATVATSGSYNDLSNKPTIPTVNNATLTIQKNGTTVDTFTANASSNVTANITVPTKVSELDNDSNYLTSVPNLDASKITSGTIDIERLPAGALERLVVVADETARFALTTSSVQLGDTVKQLDTGIMYYVVDTSKLNSADGYSEYTAGSATSVPWSGVTGKPSSYTPSSHTHGNITNAGAIGTTANKPLITTTGGTVTTGSFGTSANTFCEGNDSRLSDARTPTAHTHSASDITSGLATVATSGSYEDLSNKPTIPTVNNATLTIQKNSSNVATFTANASSNVTANITVPTKVSELTNDSGYLTSHQSLSNYSTLANTVKSLSISGKTITVTPGSGSAYTLTTQDTVYTHPTTAGNKHVPSGGSSGQFLGWDSAGTAKWVNNPNSDTKNTAGSTDTSSKIFLVGATSQAANPQTYSHDTAYVGTDGCLYSGGTKVLTAHQSLSNYSTLANTIKSLSISGKTITYTKGDNTTGTLTTQDTNTTYSAGTNLSLSGTKFNVSSTPSFTNITINGYTITVD